MASIILPPGSAPANPSEGEIYYDNTAKQVKFRDNAGFKALGTADLQGEPHIITKKLFPVSLLPIKTTTGPLFSSFLKVIWVMLNFLSSSVIVYILKTNLNLNYIRTHTNIL